MLRKTVNASRLQEECARRLQRMQAIQEDGVKIQVPRPRLRAPDAGGCNWEMPEFGNAVGFKQEIAAVLAAVQREFNLAEEPTEPAGHDATAADARGRQDPFSGAATSKPRKPADPFAPPDDE